jgi:(2Fe-2S) ferredoxin
VFEEETKRLGIKVDIRRCGCIGMCYAEPLVEVSVAGLPKVTYGKVDKNVGLEIIQEHLAHGRLVNDYIFDMPMNR